MCNFHSICIMNNLQHVQFATRATFNTCNLQYLPLGTCVICNMCNLQHMQGTTCAMYDEICKNTPISTMEVSE